MGTTALFFFAHQDDEFGVFERILRARDKGLRVCCAYLTSGVPPGTPPARRNAESIRVLSQLGVAAGDACFAGEELGIGDGELVRHLCRAVDWITGWIGTFDALQEVYVPAWEGGHPDHDALHAAVVVAALRSSPTVRLHQFPLYNGYRCVGPLFRVFEPLPANGPAESVPIAWRHRLRFLRYCLSYPSQAKSWFGLFPFTLCHYVLHGVERTQQVRLQRLRERPHGGPLYYERRGFCTWKEMQSAVTRCLDAETALSSR